MRGLKDQNKSNPLRILLRNRTWRDALNVCFLTKSRRQNWFLANCQVFGVSLLCTGISTSTHAHGVEQVCDYTDRQTASPLTDLAQNFIWTYIHDDKTV
ncbi:hypothetical protein AVEN_36905-1 [Araneus ventricosus]|uniref:Uncharacterized protein n=1 Tax=Araneus ventricosus TaxID=182803 RepID=A0A4Y2D2L5_ARAVE|nr:hypothetical protein AVEN_36905-1 [Araneus ventricosus]